MECDRSCQRHQWPTDSQTQTLCFPFFDSSSVLQESLGSNFYSANHLEQGRLPLTEKTPGAHQNCCFSGRLRNHRKDLVQPQIGLAAEVSMTQKALLESITTNRSKREAAYLRAKFANMRVMIQVKCTQQIAYASNKCTRKVALNSIS